MKNLLDFIEQRQIQFIDFRFTDIRGTWHHITYPVSALNEGLFQEGIYFDGSSIPGWCAINKSDMLLKPDLGHNLENLWIDPFSSYPTAIAVCNIFDPTTHKPYEKDPRFIAKKCLGYVKSTGIADMAYFGPEVEFFIFDSVLFQASSEQCFYEIHSDEMPSSNSYRQEHNHGHRPSSKGGYFPVSPTDAHHDLRTDILHHMGEIGLKVEKHHHEVAPAQHEIGIVFDNLLRCADQIQIYKYVVRNVAHKYGKTATFMPKPYWNDNGSGMHVHQSLWKDNQPLFAGNGYAGLSETALHYIGGILKHAKSLNAFTNPTTNSYKRLVPGFEAPVICAYSMQNRSASCRIPVTSSPQAKRVEVRFPDPSANSYLAFSAMLMAGLDGIQNNLHPGDPQDVDLFEEKHIAQTLPSVSGSLEESLKSLENDHEYLLRGDVFSKELIETHLSMRWQEHYRFAHHTHPVEFEMYYSC